MVQVDIKKWIANRTLTMIGNQPICDMECVPQEGEPIIGAGDPRDRSEITNPNECQNYYKGNTRPNPNFKAGKCVITGDGFCGHPRRNALQPHHMRKPEIVQRWLACKRLLTQEEAAKKDG